jgi:transposase-like protein
MTTGCPTCGSHSRTVQGSKRRPGRFRCKDCGREYIDRSAIPHHQTPRLLSIDIETLPGKFYSWSPAVDYLGRHMMITDWSLLSFSAKWVGDDRIISSVLTSEEAIMRDDRRLAIMIQALLDRAHTVITHNGRRFDIKKINTRLWKHKLQKPSDYRVIDTLVTAKSVFGLSYNTMDFIAEFVERDQKLHTSQSLWTGADHGDPTSLATMLEYNDQDVRTQEQIYMEMRPWIKGHPNLAIIAGKPDACPVCLHQGGHKHIGFHYTNKKAYKEFRCPQCGSTWHNNKAEK